MAADPNLDRLTAAAHALGPLMDELCLVGGCAAGILITDPAASAVRPTLDVDMLVEALQYARYQRFCERVRRRGFYQDTSGHDPICRWRKGGLVVDVMPLAEQVLGFTNRWYRSAFEHRSTFDLGGGLRIRSIDAPHFLATKLDAFAGRGGGDFVTSPDLEDLVRVVDGRPEVLEELEASSKELRRHVASGLQALLGDRFFMEALPEYFDSGDARSGVITRRLEAIIALG